MNTKKLLILSVVALVLILFCAVMLVTLISGLSPKAEPKQEPEDYLAGSWPVFTLRAWDPEQGSLELDYPLRFSYEQMQKYGKTLEELQELPTGNLQTVADLKVAFFQSTGVQARSVTVYGMTSDGRIAYTVYPDGSIRTCWEEP